MSRSRSSNPPRVAAVGYQAAGRPLPRQIEVLRHRGERRLEVKLGGVVVAVTGSAPLRCDRAGPAHLARRAPSVASATTMAPIRGCRRRELEALASRWRRSEPRNSQWSAGRCPDCRDASRQLAETQTGGTELPVPRADQVRDARLPQAATQAPQPSRWSKRTRRTSALRGDIETRQAISGLSCAGRWPVALSSGRLTVVTREDAGAQLAQPGLTRQISRRRIAVATSS